jgi:hypothetical protein
MKQDDLNEYKRFNRCDSWVLRTVVGVVPYSRLTCDKIPLYLIPTISSPLWTCIPPMRNPLFLSAIYAVGCMHRSISSELFEFEKTAYKILPTRVNGTYEEIKELAHLITQTTNPSVITTLTDKIVELSGAKPQPQPPQPPIQPQPEPKPKLEPQPDIIY